MRILDKYLLFTFVKTFLSVFAILYFIFILQGVWVFISELAGKDLDLLTIVKFLFFYSPRMISMVLPLSVLLASIMTFGDFSENYEFAAMKSAGISLQRAMRPLIFFIIGLSFLSFWFVNNVAPKSEYKFVNMRRDILQTKPAMAIAPGQFNDLGSLNIKVDKKSGKKGELLDNVTMHMRTDGTTNTKVIKSDSGRIETNDKSNVLKLHLLEGHYYEDILPKSFNEEKRLPFAKSHFQKYTLNIDLSQFDKSSENQEEISNTASMMTVNQLAYTIDSLSTSLHRELKSQNDNLATRTETALQASKQKIKALKSFTSSEELLQGNTRDEQLQILRNAASTAENIAFTSSNNQLMSADRLKNINRHEHTLHEKFVLAFSCLLMFFIGAPLGAIIRKGGLGLPMVFAVIIFITFHFINTFGKKLAQENGISGWTGAWLATFVLLPLAINLTNKATKDRGITSIDNLIHPVKVYFKKIFKKNNKTKQHV